MRQPQSKAQSRVPEARYSLANPCTQFIHLSGRPSQPVHVAALPPCKRCHHFANALRGAWVTPLTQRMACVPDGGGSLRSRAKPCQSIARPTLLWARHVRGAHLHIKRPTGIRKFTRHLQVPQNQRPKSVISSACRMRDPRRNCRPHCSDLRPTRCPAQPES